MKMKKIDCKIGRQRLLTHVLARHGTHNIFLSYHFAIDELFFYFDSIQFIQ